MANIKILYQIIFLLVCTSLFLNSSQSFLSKISKVVSGVRGLLNFGFGVETSITNNPDDVRFYLYPNPNNFSDADELIYQDKTSIKKSRLNKKLPYVFLIHGFTQRYTAEFPQNVKDAYLQNGYSKRINIIAVDWGQLTDFKADDPVEKVFFLPAYLKSAKNVYVVGQRLAEFILELLQYGYLPHGGDMVHLVGFSLGGHVAGMASKHFASHTKTLIFRITGLDPAGPSFTDAEVRHRLSKGDATFVDIVHTNVGEFGYFDALGDVDFFVNGGGPVQPYCRQFADKTKSSIKNVQVISKCSHNTAPKFYAESIRNKTLKACPGRYAKQAKNCEESTKIVFGENCSPGSSGIYYIKIDL